MKAVNEWWTYAASTAKNSITRYTNLKDGVLEIRLLTGDGDGNK